MKTIFRVTKEFKFLSQILNKIERRHLIYLTSCQIIIGVLDIVSVLLFGLVALITVNGIQFNEANGTLAEILSRLMLDEVSPQIQVLILASTAVFLLTLRSASSMFLTKRTLGYLALLSSRKSQDLLARFLNQRLNSIQSKSQQESLYFITTGVDTLVVGVFGTISIITVDVVLSSLMLLGLIYVDPLMAAVAFTYFLFLAFALYKALSKRVQRYSLEHRNVSLTNNQKILEIISAFREIYASGSLPYYEQQVGNYRVKIAQLAAKKTFIPLISKYVFEIATIVGGLIFSALQFFQESASSAISTLVVFMAASARISPALLRVQTGVMSVKSNLAVAKSTREMFNILPHKSDNPHRSQDPFSDSGRAWTIELRNVTFGYSDGALYQDLNLRLDEGQSLGILGPSGTGKTTLVDLIIGLHEPQLGSVLIGGQRPSVKVMMNPGKIAYVAQNSFIFNGTIRDNICLGKEVQECSDEEIWKALRLASLSDFVQNKTQGLEYWVGDRGTRLSGGQRQRLSLARALIAKPRILILDEATNALDAENEKKFMETIKSIRKNCTVIMITHREDLIRDFTKTLKIQDSDHSLTVNS